MSIQTDYAYGKAANRVRKLQRQWDHWFSLRQHNPHMGSTVEQQIAEIECGRIAPLLIDAKLELEEIMSAVGK